MRVAIYARKSTAEQGKRKEDTSVERQVTSAKEYIIKKGWGLAKGHIYGDDGISGAEFINRPGFARMIAHLDSGAFDTIVCMERSRLGRDPVHTNYHIKYILDSDVQIHYYLTDEAELFNDPTQMLIGNIKGYADQMERVKGRERSAEAHRQKAKKGFAVQAAPYGYVTMPMGADGKPWTASPTESKPSHSKYVVVDDEAEVVRQIFQMYLQGYGTPRIAKALGEKNIDPPRRSHRKGWWPGTITDILQREMYAGKLVWGRTRREDRKGRSGILIRQEPSVIIDLSKELRIITRETFDLTQKRMRRERALYLRNRKGQLQGKPTTQEITGRDRKHLLTGMVSCSVCGSAIVARGGGKRGHRQRLKYYVCCTFHLKGRLSCPNGTAVKVSELDGILMDSLADLLAPDLMAKALERVKVEMRKQKKDHPNAAKIKEKSKAKLEMEIQRLIERIAGDPNAPRSVMQTIAHKEKQLDRVAQEISELRSLPHGDDRAMVEARKIAESCIKDAKKYLQGSIPQARQLIQKLFPVRLTLHSDGHTISLRGHLRLDGLSALGTSTHRKSQAFP